MYIAIDIEFSKLRLPDYIELVTGEEAAQWFVGGMATEAAENRGQSRRGGCRPDQSL